MIRCDHRTPRQPLAARFRPLNANVSLRDQAYAALKQAIMDADIYAHREEIRLDERQLLAGARRLAARRSARR